MNIFEQAVRQQLRFNFKGSITVEQLYNTRKTESFKNELISYEESLTEECEKYSKSSRRNGIERTQIQKENELRLALVTNLLDEIIAMEKASEEAASKREKKQELLSLKAMKEQESLRSLTLEEINQKIKELG